MFLLGWLFPMVSTGKIRPRILYTEVGVMLLVWGHEGVCITVKY